MSRWKYPFKSADHAKKFLQQAEKATGKKCFVRRVEYTLAIYKIFSSIAEYETYKERKNSLPT